MSELHFLLKELSLSNDLLYMQTDMGCLSYEHGYVLTVAWTHAQPVYRMIAFRSSGRKEA